MHRTFGFASHIMSVGPANFPGNLLRVANSFQLHLPESFFKGCREHTLCVTLSFLKEGHHDPTLMSNSFGALVQNHCETNERGNL